MKVREPIHILAAVAEHQAKAMSDRTKAALAAAKRRAMKLGGEARAIGRRGAALPGPVRRGAAISFETRLRTSDRAHVRRCRETLHLDRVTAYPHHSNRDKQTPR